LNSLQLSDRDCRQSVASGLLICTVLAALVLPVRAYAQFTGKASATGQFESNSNVFNLESGFTQPGTNNFPRSDTYYAYGAEFDGLYLLGLQQIYATASTTEYDYQHLTELSHNEYKLDAGLNWVLGELLDGKLDVTRTRTMVPFFDLVGSDLALSLATEQRETGQIGLKLSSDWRVEGTAFTSIIDEPIPQAPNQQLTQSSGTASIKYLGIGALTSGLTAGYLSGDYSGSNGTLNGPFRQSTAGFLADYKHNRMTFEGQVGYTHRISDIGGESLSGFTGLLEIKEQLTPKTGVMVKIDRMINNYIAVSGSEIDSEAGASIDWQATYKLAVSLAYTFTYRAFPQPAFNGSYQVDYQQHATMGINYQPRRWLLIRPYANVLTRRSNFIGYDFNSTIFGVSVTATTAGTPR
jgi:hypothetical protein